MQVLLNSCAELRINLIIKILIINLVINTLFKIDVDEENVENVEQKRYMSK